MAINSYTTLKTAIAAWAHRSDIDSVIDDFIDITESMMNRSLRVSQQETLYTVSAGSEYIAFPSDLLAIRNVQLNTTPVQELLYVAPMEMDRLAQTGETIGRYTIIGDELQLNATSSETLEIAYYAKIPALSDSNLTNWVIDSYPEAYLYGSLAEAFKYSMDDEQAAKYAAMFNETIRQINVLDSSRKAGNGMFVRVA